MCLSVVDEIEERPDFGGCRSECEMWTAWSGVFIWIGTEALLGIFLRAPCNNAICDHFRAIVASRNIGYDCCGRRFNTFNSIRDHLDNSSAHSNEIECRWCILRWPSHAEKFRKEHEQQEYWPTCEEGGCTYIFENQKALDDHIEEHPANYCDGCQNQFQSANNLDQVCYLGQPEFQMLNG